MKLITCPFLIVGTSTFIGLNSVTDAFTLTHPLSQRQHSERTYKLQFSAEESASDDEVERLRQKAAKIRQELAILQGISVEEVEEEARREKDMKIATQKSMEDARATRKEELKNNDKKVRSNPMIYVPQSIEEQTRQASLAIERAFQDGITRQTVRLALAKEGYPITPAEDENGWPGGAKQMYREAGKPLTEALLREVRATATTIQTEDEKNSGKQTYPPIIKTQDIWDFDGSALITAEAAWGPSGDVQAMVFPNTDTKYLKDIREIDESLGKERLFLLVNPFWRNVESWGFNILAPNAKAKAQETIFDCEGGGFQETYVFSRFSARGEDCVAIKAYPHDWELFAYLEEYSYGGPIQTAIRLGTSREEPTSKLFTELLNSREEFKMNKTMRQLNKFN
eukprot:CAMPEP_0176478870 /NCGR_PEP_ID=MMETSP0200_2-20121128/1420_1 /TAXON_ID=947934 /ORGANISM="Chaetoceros sp., Strain GSL56" /LENGTH=396 /DNA_ID=CAMNT_0017874843 /DNA_START=39 /DNA_END=1229 /DNA_ORIENTATION=-